MKPIAEAGRAIAYKGNTVAIFKGGKCHVGKIIDMDKRQALVHLRDGEKIWCDERKLRAYKGDA